jgi:2-iminobutanoate/2-iminopropanoate deaminase
MRVARYAFLLALCAGAVASSAGAQVIEKKLILLPDAPNKSPGIAPGVMVGNTLYMSGATPPRAMRDSSIAVQTKATIASIKAILQVAGMDLPDVVSVTVHLADINDFNAFSGAYAEMFTTDPRPARTTVAVAGLVGGAKLELTMTAVKTK